jgi:2-dehydro-3-deoxygluconokinase
MIVSDVVSVGECMVELSRGSDGRYGLAFGGDTFNTAVYLARAGVAVAYATRLGDDPYSAGILDVAAAEGVATGLIGRSAGRMPGLYLIETSDVGERTFWYWRDRAPAREVFEAPEASVVLEAMAAARMIYFSGTTLSLYTPRGLDIFEAGLKAARARGAQIAMDSNFRPRGWGGDLGRARETFRRFWSLADIAMPTFDDEQALWQDAAPAQTADRLRAVGVREVVVKNGPEGAFVRRATGDEWIGCPDVVQPIDTTAAGDSFNAAYLAARLRGAEPAAAAVAGHRLAAVVIRHRGAIVPKTATAAVFAG